MTVDAQPTVMDEGDYKLFIYSLQKRAQALVAAMTAVDQEMLISYLRSVGPDSDAFRQSLSDIEALSVSMSYLRARYELADDDQITQDRQIVRTQRSQSQLAEDLSRQLNGHNQTPRRLRRANEQQHHAG